MKYIVVLNGKKYEVEVEKGEATAVYAGNPPHTDLWARDSMCRGLVL